MKSNATPLSDSRVPLQLKRRRANNAGMVPRPDLHRGQRRWEAIGRTYMPDVSDIAGGLCVNRPTARSDVVFRHSNPPSRVCLRRGFHISRTRRNATPPVSDEECWREGRVKAAAHHVSATPRPLARKARGGTAPARSGRKRNRKAKFSDVAKRRPAGTC